jgi:enoyl-CoA hydratase/carnithine racemase
MTPEMVAELNQLTLELECDSAVRVVVVTGDSEDAFITHFDVAALVADARDAAVVSPGRARAALEALEPWRHPHSATASDAAMPVDLPIAAAAGLLALHEPLDRMGRMDAVWIAAINGLALGGGFELALACDLRYMADRSDARLGFPEALFGISPGMGGIQRLTRAVGASQALELLLEGTLLPASRAVELGLVHRAVAPDRLLEETRVTAERLARRSPGSVGVLKRSVYEGASRSMGEGLHIDRAGAIATVSSQQGQIALSELVRRYPSSRPLPSAEYLRELEAWQRGEVVDLGGA